MIEADDPDGTGWSFTIEGLDDFGELRKAESGREVGTEVVLHLRAAHVGPNPRFLLCVSGTTSERSIRRVPCRFTYSAPSLGIEPFTANLGWVDRSEEVRNFVLTQIDRSRRRGSSSGPALSQARIHEKREAEIRQELRSKIEGAADLGDQHRGESPGAG